MLLKNRYRIIQLIGQGGAGKTFAAVDEGVSPPLSCVVKEFRVQSQLNTEVFGQRSHKLKELGNHPQIPTLLDAWQEESGNIYLVNELIEGKNLAQLIENNGVLNEAEIWQLLDELLPVLQVARDHQVIHGDIKPENIICRGNKAEPWGMRSQVEPGNEDDENRGQFVLVDWGAVRVGIDVEPLIGSAEYAAPEQARGKAVFASDLYSLGVVCIYLLTGISPFNLFDSASDRIIWHQDTEVSDRLAFILDKLTQKDLNQRFQSADEVMQIIGHKSQIQNPLAQRRVALSKIQNSPCLRTLTGHAGLFAGVNSVAISPDNRILASGSDDKTIRLWDVETGDAIATLFGHTNFVQSVAFSPDGMILASGSDDKTIKLWDLKTYQEICTLSGHSRAVKSVTFNPIPPNPPYQGGREENFSDQGGLEDNFPTPAIEQGILASGSWDKTIKLWDLQTKEVICTLSGHQLQVTSVAFSPDGKLLASASFDRTVRLWDWQQLERLKPKFKFQILSDHTWPIFSVAFSPNGEILATGGDDKTIKLWDIKTGEIIHTLLGHSWSVVAVAFSPDGETLVSGSWDKTIKVWNVRTGEEIATLAGHLDAVCAIAVSPDGQIIASGSKDKTIKLWRLSQ